MVRGQGPGRASEQQQVAMGRVAQAMHTGEPVEGVEGFDALPESVQQALRNLSPDERRIVAKTLRTFADSGFHVELPDGGTVGFF